MKKHYRILASSWGRLCRVSSDPSFGSGANNRILTSRDVAWGLRSSLKSVDSVGSTKPRNIGPPESAIMAWKNRKRNSGQRKGKKKNSTKAAPWHWWWHKWWSDGILSEQARFESRDGPRLLHFRMAVNFILLGARLILILSCLPIII